VNGDLVVEGHYSKIPPAEFRDYGPESVPIVLLALDPEGILDDGDAPLATQVWPLPQYLAFEILREAILRHDRKVLRACSTCPGAG
jgi:hypothetical protein